MYAKSKWGYPRSYYGACLGKYHLAFVNRYSADKMRKVYREYSNDHCTFNQRTLVSLLKRTGLVNRLYD